jgi:hypothetical protein
MKTPEGGLAAVAYSPSRVETTLKGVGVSVELETDYPFREELHFTVCAARPVAFALALRIPAWAKEARLQVKGEPARQPAAGSFHTLALTWGAETRFTLTLPAHPELIAGYNGAVALGRGALVFALPIGEDWRQVHTDVPDRERPHADWEVYPTTPWNYALQVSPASLESDVAFTMNPLSELPFSPQGAPLSARVMGRRLPAWGMQDQSAADAPPSPVSSAEPLEPLTLIPYGCTNLRITEFPVLG